MSSSHKNKPPLRALLSGKKARGRGPKVGTCIPAPHHGPRENVVVNVARPVFLGKKKLWKEEERNAGQSITRLAAG